MTPAHAVLTYQLLVLDFVSDLRPNFLMIGGYPMTTLWNCKGFSAPEEGAAPSPNSRLHSLRGQGRTRPCRPALCFFHGPNGRLRCIPGACSDPCLFCGKWYAGTGACAIGKFSYQISYRCFTARHATGVMVAAWKLRCADNLLRGGLISPGQPRIKKRNTACGAGPRPCASHSPRSMGPCTP